MLNKIILFLFLLSVNVFSQTDVIFIQLNDVYEISPLENGKVGGLARVATIIENYKSKYPNTFTVMAGDFISPSALATSEFEGKRINGRQMVEVLNIMGLDYVTFGNHEFDYKYEVLQDRINESAFRWISSNVKYNDGSRVIPFSKVMPIPDNRWWDSSYKAGTSDFPEYELINIKTAKGKDITIGMLGLCLGANKQPYVSYEDPFESAGRIYTDIKNKSDIVIGLTHLTIDDDKKLATELPELKLIMGGHEHVNMKHIVGETVITKADANAKTVYVHTLHFNSDNRLDNIKSELINIDNTIPEQPQVKILADEWTTRAFKGFYDKGFDALQLVIDLKDKTLDGREETVRFRQNELGNLIARAMMSAAPNSVMAAFNSGSIRIDDELRGEVTQYDIIRTMPFGGKIMQVEMKGELLQKVLEQGTKNRGAGGYLLYQNAMFNSGEWLIGTFALKPESVYNVAINDFLMSGMEKGLEYLTKENPGIIKIHEPDPNDSKDLRNDIRFAVIEYMKKTENK